MDMDNDIKIAITLKDKPDLLATAIVSLNTIDFGFITIHGFVIWRSKYLHSRLQEAINITPPSIRTFKHYAPIVFFENDKRWFELEQKIYDAFNAKRTNSNSEEIDLDDVAAGIENMTQEENKAKGY